MRRGGFGGAAFIAENSQPLSLADLRRVPFEHFQHDLLSRNHPALLARAVGRGQRVAIKQLRYRPERDADRRGCGRYARFPGGFRCRRYDDRRRQRSIGRFRWRRSLGEPKRGGSGGRE